MLKRALLIILFLALFLTACAQKSDVKIMLGKEYAKQELIDVLNNGTKSNILVEKVITDKETATSVAESILFKIYGKDKIIEQRPYECYLIDDYWVLSGTLPKSWTGGTFLIIINSIDSRIIKLTHGK